MQPNIVFCLLDAARARNCSCYGYGRPTTPFLDDLAESSTLFSRAFANSIFSLPSYASIFTGQYPTDHGAVDWGCRVERNRLVDGLNDQGYETRAVSTHLVSDDFGIGPAFDTVEQTFEAGSLPFDNDPVAEAMQEKAAVDGWDSPGERYRYFFRAFLANPSLRSVANGAAQFVRRLRRKYGYWSDDGAREAVKRAKSVIKDAREPFFLFTNFVETHDPYRPPRGYIKRFLPDDVAIETIEEALDYSSIRASASLDHIDTDQREILMSLYDAELAYLDNKLADLHEYLADQGLLDQTVFVVCADHGDFFGEHGLWGHQAEIFSQVVHVPLIISTPWGDGRTVAAATELRQLCEFLLSIANGDQTSLSPAGEALVEYYGWDTQLSFNPSERFEKFEYDRSGLYQSMLIDERWSLLWDADDRTELYNVQSDFEQKNGVTAENPETVAEYQRRIESLVGNPSANHERYRAHKQGRQDLKDADEAVRNRLRELGYME